MTVESREGPVTEAVPSPEVRWIFPGQLETVPLPSQLARRSPAPRGRLLRATWVSVPS